MSAASGASATGLIAGWEAIRRDRKATIGFMLIAAFVLLGVIGPWVAVMHMDASRSTVGPSAIRGGGCETLVCAENWCTKIVPTARPTSYRLAGLARSWLRSLPERHDRRRIHAGWYVSRKAWPSYVGTANLGRRRKDVDELPTVVSKVVHLLVVEVETTLILPLGRHSNMLGCETTGVECNAFAVDRKPRAASDERVRSPR